MVHRRALRFVLTTSILSLAACGPAAELGDVASEASDLELEYGGIDEADEAPMFGDASFALLDEATEEPSAPEARDPEDPAEARRADYVDLAVTLLWGKLRPDPAETEVTDWTGGLAVEGAAIARVRPIRFEARDAISPRSDRGHVAWVSHTGPHHDGIAVLLRVPREAPEDARRALALRTRAFSVTIPLADLAHMNRVVDVGDNQVAIHAFIVRPEDCASGFLRGHWAAPDSDGRGRFLGRWISEDGSLRGHVRGLYGERTSGEQVFFGKVIDRQGRFIGRLAGRYEAGEFHGRWVARGGAEGGVAGRYARGANGQGGTFVGRWAERCEGPSTMPEQPTRPEPTRGE